MKALRGEFGNTAKRIFAALLAAVLALGLAPWPASANPTDEAAVGAGAVQLEPGTYVEHEAVAYVVDGVQSAAMPFSLGDDVLSGAQELMRIDATAAEEALVDTEGTVATAPPARANALSDADGSAAKAGRLVLVRNEAMSAEELIAELEADPRVAFAEPNCVVDDGGADEPAAADDGADEPDVGNETVDGAGVPASDGAAANEPAAQDEPVVEGDADGSPNGLRSSGGDGAAGVDGEARSGGEPDAEFGADSSGPVSDLTSFQWGFDNDGRMGGIDAADAIDMRSSEWDAQDPDEGLQEAVVAVIDSGVDASNPDLANVMWNEGLTSGIECVGGEDEHGFSTVEGAGSTTGLTNYHGTHVAGIIGAEWNGEGISGIASNVRIMAVRHSDTLATLLACFDYVSRARDAGVDVRVTNNSWGIGQQASRSVSLAVTELGQKGVTSVFAAGNSAMDNDAAYAAVTGLAENPYVVVADAIEPDGSVAAYSQYGETTTDVMAAGSVVLSTWATGEASGSGAVESPVYLGEGDEDAVFYESFDGESHQASGVSRRGPQPQKLSFVGADGSPVGQERKGAAFDGDTAYAVPYTRTDPQNAVQSYLTSPLDLSDVAEKPRYLSLRYRIEDADQTTYPQVIVAVKLNREATGHDWAQFSPLGMTALSQWQGFYLDLDGMAQVDDGSAMEITANDIDWENFQLLVNCVVFDFSMTGGVQSSTGTPVPCTVLFDSIGLGCDLVPYQYDQGTSMACPAVAGAAAAIAGTGKATVAGDAAKSAEKLAALVRGAAQPDGRYEGLCSTGGFATVDGAKNPGPAITKVIDDGENVRVQGYFMSENAQVQLGGMDAHVVSCTDLGDRKAELVVAKPDSFAGGQVTVRVSENGKESRQKADLGEAAGVAYYDQTGLPVPDELDDWGSWQLVGFAGDVYALPRTTVVEDPADRYEFMMRYDPSTQEWQRVDFPDEAALKQAGLENGVVVDVTAATLDGDLMVLLSDINGVGSLFRYTVEGAWEPVGLQTGIAETNAGWGTLASDGEALYLFGGLAVSPQMQAVGDCPYIYRIDPSALTMERVGRMATGRVRPQVSFGNDSFAVSGGVSISYQAGGVSGAELVAWTSGSIDVDTGEEGEPELQGSVLDFSEFTQQQTGQLAYASGAVAEGFLIAGPENDAATADTYKLAIDSEELSAYDKRASEQTLLAPAATSYDGWFYVLAATENAPYRAFSATKADTVAQPGDCAASDPEPGPAPNPDPQPGVGPGVDAVGGSGDGNARKPSAAVGAQGATTASLARTGDPLASAAVAAGVAALLAAVVALAARRMRR